MNLFERLQSALQPGGQRDVIVMLGPGIFHRADLVHPTPEKFSLDALQTQSHFFANFARQWMSVDRVPNAVHHFVTRLDRIGRLSHVFTENVDGLESATGVYPHRVTQVYGTWDSASCPKCNLETDVTAWKEVVRQGQLPPTCVTCNSFTKPDLVFGGEDPLTRGAQKFETAKIVLVLGSALKMDPFSSFATAAHAADLCVAVDLFQVQWEHEVLQGDPQIVCERLLQTVPIPINVVERTNLMVYPEMARAFVRFCFGDDFNHMVSLFVSARRKYMQQGAKGVLTKQDQFIKPQVVRSRDIMATLSEHMLLPPTTSKGFDLDPTWCALYMGVNLRDNHKAMQLMATQMLKELHDHGRYHDRTPTARYGSCVRRKSSAVACNIFTIDADTARECALVDKALAVHGVEASATVVTRGGHHYLFRLRDYSRQEKTIFFKTIVPRLEQLSITCDPDMHCPVPGTLQGGQLVTWTVRS